MSVRKGWSLVGVACLAFLVIVGTACSSPAPAAAPQPAAPTAAAAAPAAPKPLEKVTFRVDFAPLGHYAPFWLAKERGYYKEAGLDVEIMPGSGSLKTVEAVAAKELDFGFVASGVFAMAKGSGRPVRSVSMILNTNTFGFLFPENSSIKTVKDLEGKSLIYPPGSPQAAVLPGVFKLTGTDGSKVKQIQVEISGYIGAYGAGQGDAVASGIYAIGPMVKAQRPSRHILWADVGFVLPEFSIVANEDTTKQRPDTVRRFVAATLRGWNEAPKNQNEALDALIKNWGDLMLNKDRSVAAEQLKGYLENSVYSTDTKGKPLGTHSVKEWKIGLETLKEYSGLQGSTDPKDYVTDEFLPK